MPEHSGLAWTEAELDLVRLNYQDMSHADLAAVLGRSEGAIRNLCYKRGWRKGPPLWTDTEIELLRRYYEADPVDLDELAARLGRLKSNVCRKARELGLTHYGRPKTAETIQKIASRARQWYEVHEHPRGYEGHQHSKESRAKISTAVKASWDDPASVFNSEDHRQRMSDITAARRQAGTFGRQAYSRGKMGKRADLDGLYVRSAWEANYARYLNWLVEQDEILRWEYEPDIFIFHAIKRGTRSYTPDFKVWADEQTYEYHEVKGWMDAKSKTRLKRMAKYYPNERVILVGADEYQTIQRQIGALIDNWE